MHRIEDGPFLHRIAGFYAGLKAFEPRRFLRWTTLLPSREEIVLLLCAGLVQIEVRGPQSKRGTRVKLCDAEVDIFSI